MKVNETIAKMIRNWPILHPTRKDALRHVFIAPWVDWTGGEPNFDGLMSNDDRPLDDEDAEIEKLLGRRGDVVSAAKQKYIDAETVSTRLRVRRRNMETKFLLDNADLIAMDTQVEFDCPPTFSLYELNRIPLEKLNDEWKAALVEFCHEVQFYDECKIDIKYHDHNVESRDRQKRALADAKKTAAECLSRLDPSAEAVKARAAKLAEVRALAAALGYELTAKA